MKKLDEMEFVKHFYKDKINIDAETVQLLIYCITVLVIIYFLRN